MKTLNTRWEDVIFEGRKPGVRSLCSQKSVLTQCDHCDVYHAFLPLLLRYLSNYKRDVL